MAKKQIEKEVSEDEVIRNNLAMATNMKELKAVLRSMPEEIKVALSSEILAAKKHLLGKEG